MASTLLNAEEFTSFFSWFKGSVYVISLIASSAGAVELHRLHLCIEVIYPNECPVNDTKQSNALWNAECYFIAIAPRSTLAQSGSTW